ncbi:MAG: two-component system, response regulator PdtaR [Clostridiales bacterium]|jgi:response regulator NasT|nr:two-component system, response regulator PdtaR [Clostridiales bacterium]
MRQLIIAFANADLVQKVRTLLNSCGINASELCTTAAGVLQAAARLSGGGVVLCPGRLPDMAAASLMDLLPEDFDMLLVVSSHQQGVYDKPGVFTLTQPFQTATLADSVRQLLETRQLIVPASAPVSKSVSGTGTGIGRRIVKNTGTSPDLVSSGGVSASASSAESIGQHQRSLEEQKLIAQAKYLLMNRKKIDEAQAHRYLQRRSMESGVRMVDLARQILGG